MRKTLIIVIGTIVLLAGLLGYIIGTEPIGKSATDEENSTSAEQSIDTSTAGSQAKELPSYNSLLITPSTSPLPLSLQAGVYYNTVAANAALEKVKELGYKKVSVAQFSDQNKQTLNVVLLGPFNNEAELQLAQYELSTANITTQRIITPKPAKASS